LRDAVEAWIGHTQLFALIHIRRALQKVQRRGEHLGRDHAVLAVVTKARDHPWLIVVAPEQRVPAAAGLHAHLPVGENLLELQEVEVSLHPLLQVGVIDFQVVEVEGHRQFFRRWIRVANAVFQAGG